MWAKPILQMHSEILDEINNFNSQCKLGSTAWYEMSQFTNWNYVLWKSSVLVIPTNNIEWHTNEYWNSILLWYKLPKYNKI